MNEKEFLNKYRKPILDYFNWWFWYLRNPKEAIDFFADYRSKKSKKKVK